MPLTMDEYDYLRETTEQVKGLTDLASERAIAEAEAPLPVDGLPVVLLAFPIRVRFKIPKGGLGSRLNHLRRWLGNEIGPVSMP